LAGRWDVEFAGDVVSVASLAVSFVPELIFCNPVGKQEIQSMPEQWWEGFIGNICGHPFKSTIAVNVKVALSTDGGDFISATVPPAPVE